MKPDRLIRWGNPPTGISNAPIYLGLQTGTFGMSGVRVEARDNLTGADYTEALVAGAYDMGHIGTPPFFAALARTREYVMVGLGLVKSPPFYLMAPPAVHKMRDLSNQVITLNKLRTCLHSIIRTLLRWEGMDDREVRLATLVEAWAIVEAIRRRETAAAILWEPYVSYVERVFGWRVLAEGRNVIAPSNYGFALYARRSLLAAEPGLVLGMLEAYAESVRAARRDVGTAAATVRDRIPDVLPEDVDKGLAREAPHWSADISLDSGFLQRVMGELEVQTVIPERFDLAEHVAEVLRAA